jgi:hypothetical protein
MVTHRFFLAAGHPQFVVGERTPGGFAVGCNFEESGQATAKVKATGPAKAGRYRWRGDIVMRWGRLG